MNFRRSHLLLLVLLLSSGACRKAVSKAEANADAREPRNPMEVSVTPALAGGLKIGPPRMNPVRGTLEVTARVQTDARLVARVGSPVAGRILEILVYEGQHVKAGEVLARLHSTSLSDAQLALVKAYSDQALAEAASRRADQLVAADVIGSAEVERRRAELLQASAEVASYRTQLQGLGMTEAQIRHLQTTHQLSADYPVVAPRGGSVLERKVTVGQVVQPADPAFTISDLSHVWIVANVPEEDSGRLRKDMEVTVRVPALPTEKISGRLSYVSPIVDPATRTVEVRMNLPNPNSLYKPDELASMTFTGQTEDKLTVPQAAVVREENQDFVFVETAPNKFLLRAVKLGDESGDERVVESGVAVSERIVLDGAFHLNNQRKQNAIKGDS